MFTYFITDVPSVTFVTYFMKIVIEKYVKTTPKITPDKTSLTQCAPRYTLEITTNSIEVTQNVLNRIFPKVLKYRSKIYIRRTKKTVAIVA